MYLPFLISKVMQLLSEGRDEDVLFCVIKAVWRERERSRTEGWIYSGRQIPAAGCQYVKWNHSVTRIPCLQRWNGGRVSGCRLLVILMWERVTTGDASQRQRCCVIIIPLGILTQLKHTNTGFMKPNHLLKMIHGLWRKEIEGLASCLQHVMCSQRCTLLYNTIRDIIWVRNELNQCNIFLLSTSRDGWPSNKSS